MSQTKKLFNKTREIEVVRDVRVAYTFAERTMGLIGKKSMAPSSTLWIQGSSYIPCNSIHTCFMRFAIDVAFVDKDLKVKAVYRDIRPWRITPVVKGAWSVFEFPAGTITASLIEVGDQLHVGA